MNELPKPKKKTPEARMILTFGDGWRFGWGLITAWLVSLLVLFPIILVALYMISFTVSQVISDILSLSQP